MTYDTVGRTPAAHRADVVRRLLDRGVSPRTLMIVLPAWGPTITSALGDNPENAAV